MRKLLFFALFIFVKMSVAAQDYTYKPMIEKGKVWNFETTCTYPFEDGSRVNLVRNFSYIINGDVGDYGWLKVYEIYDNEGYDEYYHIEDISFEVEEKDKILKESYGDPQYNATTILDFNLHKGDQIMLDDFLYYNVIDEDYITVKGNTYRRLHINVNNDGIADGTVDDYWVEGIGTKKFIHITQYVVPSCGDYWYGTPRLMSVYKDGVCIFERADFDTPGFTSGIEENVSNSTEPVLGFYDLQGRKLGSEPQKGIYIKNGRKVAIEG